MKFETRAIHDGQKPDTATGAVIVPVYQTSTYEQEEIGKHKGFEYSRTGNPTRQALEEALASLENGKFGLAFASGLAATSAVLSTLKSGDHVVSGNDVYGGTFRLFEKVFKQWGLDVTYADVDNIDSFAKAIRKNTKLIWVESPTNPLLKIIDVKRLAKIAKKNRLLLAVDNTFASPVLQRPLELGATVVVHSTTKYINGHSDVVGGALITSDLELAARLKFLQNAIGAVPSPMDCYLVLRGIKTLPLRMRQHVAAATEIATRLERAEGVLRVHYPGLPSHPQHDLCRVQMAGGGGIITVELDGGLDEARRFLMGLRIFTLAESLGGVESLAEHPALMTHASLPPARRAELGITDGLVRLSIGIENVEELWADLEQALSAAKARL